MERLTGLDAGFLYMETPALHMHTLKIGIVDPSTVPGGYSFQKLREVMAERMHLLPPFRRRIVEVPFGLHHPVWIDDPDLDLGYHLRRVGCPAPGGPREFCELVSDIASRPLDRGRPLWEIWAVEGLEGGRIGFVGKIHHSVADGVAAAALLANVMGDAEPESHPPVPEPVPSRWTLLRDAAADLAKALAKLPTMLRTTIAAILALSRRRKTADVSPPLPFATPNLSFNGSLSPRRSFAMTSLSLDEVKAVRTATGATVNDVVLAICAGALRRYLADRGELPDRPLVAGVPVSTASEPGRLGGNKVSNMFTALPVQIEDPVERLRSISEVTKAAKEVHNVLGAEMLADWSEIAPPKPFAWFMRAYSRLGLAAKHRPPINLVVSNVPGPATPLEIAGGRLDAIYSVGPILEGIGLNITVWSYIGSMNFGLIACPDHIPDLWLLADALPDALEELRKATLP